MTKRTIGLLAGIVSSAVGGWYWVRRRAAQGMRGKSAARDRGTVIYDNTPTASGAQQPMP